MSTVFIAVQCYQCSTMQVKQKKKSSNKWNCVVCNEKQSVRKVFAEGFMAKDVRKFVQTFNMSRQFADQQSSNHETLIPQSEEIETQLQRNLKKKRTDWSEFIDPEGNEEGPKYLKNEGDPGDEFEKKFVTELPKAMFKKPKPKNNSAGSDTVDGEKLFRPVFSKRNANKPIKPPAISTNLSINNKVLEDSSSSSSNDLEMLAMAILIEAKFLEERKMRSRNRSIKDKGKSKCGGTMAKAASKLGDCTKKVNGETIADKETIKHQAVGASKWSEYINEDDALEAKNGRDFEGDVKGGWNNAEFEGTMNDEKIEDDIHPDFQ